MGEGGPSGLSLAGIVVGDFEQLLEGKTDATRASWAEAGALSNPSRGDCTPELGYDLATLPSSYATRNTECLSE